MACGAGCVRRGRVRARNRGRGDVDRGRVWPSWCACGCKHHSQKTNTKDNVHPHTAIRHGHSVCQEYKHLVHIRHAANALTVRVAGAQCLTTVLGRDNAMGFGRPGRSVYVCVRPCMCVCMSRFTNVCFYVVMMIGPTMTKMSSMLRLSVCENIV